MVVPAGAPAARSEAVEAVVLSVPGGAVVGEVEGEGALGLSDLAVETAAAVWGSAGSEAAEVVLSEGDASVDWVRSTRTGPPLRYSIRARSSSFWR